MHKELTGVTWCFARGVARGLKLWRAVVARLHEDLHGDLHVFTTPSPPPGQPLAGYVLSVYTYSARGGATLYMDNLYVRPHFRGGTPPPNKRNTHTHPRRKRKPWAQTSRLPCESTFSRFP